ncbi:MAG: hypothetical protein U5K75_01455 [Ahrensia sp.]|nr:hypothetical protein [Ahrensia sp.]
MVERAIVGKYIEIEARRVTKTKADFEKFCPVRSTRHLAPASSGSFGGAPEVILLDLPNSGANQSPSDFYIAVRAMPNQPQTVYASPTADGYQFKTIVNKNALIARLTSPLSGSFSGRYDFAASLIIELPEGELESVNEQLLLSGRNMLAVKSSNGEWEVVQFSKAIEQSPNVWKLSGLLRGQGGTEDAMISGAVAGAQVVVLDDSVVPIELGENEVGLNLNYRVGPLGKEFSDRYFTTVSAQGGLREITPLSPVHIKARYRPSGALDVSWIRRSRVGADVWLGSEIPLGEETQAYRVELTNTAGATIWNAEVSEPRLTISQTEILAAIGSLPASINVTVKQISQRIGDGLPATKTVQLLQS